ncbi:carbonic anhydrase [Macrophomina phaseolina]|uniref:Carbonic anhydrase n=1 Tax=Macrophomina phaseolina TaxID=35725 RepID=A0ABQ8GSG5_9PEZI|nr:carbonic anhydrase [Macrophomina phaseolina]
MLSYLTPLVALLPLTLACPDHSDPTFHGLVRRQVDSPDTGNGNWTTRVSGSSIWAYEASYNWGRLNPDYELCQTGTQQSPIAFRRSDATNHARTPRFTGYRGTWAGQYFNWGYGSAFNLDHPENDYTTLPSMLVGNQTLYMTGWHIHAPADHQVDGDRSKAELHFVHVDAEGHEKAVLGFLLDPLMNHSGENSTFLDQLPSPLLHYNETDKQLAMEMFFDSALTEVNNFEEHWTYQGSLTSPPCHEGIRWFVAKQRLMTSNAQMQEILRVSTFSARSIQEEWLHQVNL